MSAQQFHEIALPWIKKGVKTQTDTKIIAEVLQPRCVKLSDIPEQIDFIDELPDYSTELYISKKMKTTLENSLKALNAAKTKLESLTEWTRENIHTALFDLIAELGVKNGIVLWPLRVAVSGKQFTPGGAVEICVMLGREESLRRIDCGIKLLSK